MVPVNHKTKRAQKVMMNLFYTSNDAFQLTFQIKDAKIILLLSKPNIKNTFDCNPTKLNNKKFKYLSLCLPSSTFF